MQPPPRSGGTKGARLDPGHVRRLLRDAGLHARHSLAQNFLADVDVLEQILAEAAPGATTPILEIGAGLGVLTGGLLAAGAPVTAIELDAGLVAWLRSRFAAELELGNRSSKEPGSLRLIEGDALDEDLVHLVAPPYDVVANLPYHITSPILHALLGEAPRPRRMVLMVQREVAQRIAARPGAMSYLSVFVQYHASARVAFMVPREAFEPAPDVASAVIVVEPYGAEDAFGGLAHGRARPEALETAAEDAFWRLVQAGFRERRKMLRNVLSRQLQLPVPSVERALEAAGIAPDRRPQTLSVADWLAVHRALDSIGLDARGRSTKSPGATRRRRPSAKIRA